MVFLKIFYIIYGRVHSLRSPPAYRRGKIVSKLNFYLNLGDL
nr:MAG TPA: hypothetical protein [Crassvirales sp.]